MELSAGQVVDRYTVDAVLGEGGMAVVYAVRHNTLETRHALKVLTIRSSGIRERLIAEGKIQASLRHPNVVSVSDVLDLGGAPALLMELVEGPSLDDLLKRQGALPLAVADTLARGILTGVAAAHARGMVHRDLKPANVLLSVGPDGIVPKVADFGLARLGDSGGARTRTGTAMGTPQYMAPEQVRDAKSVGPEADVFSLGAILYEMVTGVRAFDGDDIFEIFSAVGEGRRVPVRERRPDLPARMVDAIEGALRPDRATRIASVTELLGRWVGDAGAPASLDAATVATARELANRRSTPIGSSDTWASAVGTRPAATSPSRSTAVWWGIGGGAVALLGVLVVAGVIGIVALALTWEATSTESSPVVAPAAPPVVGEASAGEQVAEAEDALAEVVEEPVEATSVAAPSSAAAVVPTPVTTAPDPVAQPAGEPPTSPEVPAEAMAEPPPPPAAEPAEAPAPASPSRSDPRAGLPMALRSQSVAIRSSYLLAMTLDPQAAPVLAVVVKTDPSGEVRTRAFRLSMEQWRRKIGDAAVHAQTAVWVSRNGASAAGRIEGLVAMERLSNLPGDAVGALRDPTPAVRAAAATAIAGIAARTGDRSADGALETALATEADSTAAAALRAALGR